MAFIWNEHSPQRSLQPVDLPPALNVAVILSQVFSARVLNELPIQPTQWDTLASRVREWRSLLANAQSRNDPLTRTHLNVLTQLMQAILEAHCHGADADADVWLELQPIVKAANDYLQELPMGVRKGLTSRRHSATGSSPSVDG
jgi:hypothetical protein